MDTASVIRTFHSSGRLVYNVLLIYAVLLSDLNLLPEVINTIESAGHCGSTSGKARHKTDQAVLNRSSDFIAGRPF